MNFQIFDDFYAVSSLCNVIQAHAHLFVDIISFLRTCWGRQLFRTNFVRKEINKRNFTNYHNVYLVTYWQSQAPFYLEQRFITGGPWRESRPPRGSVMITNVKFCTHLHLFFRGQLLAPMVSLRVHENSITLKGLRSKRRLETLIYRSLLFERTLIIKYKWKILKIFFPFIENKTNGQLMFSERGSNWLTILHVTFDNGKSEDNISNIFKVKISGKEEFMERLLSY